MQLTQLKNFQWLLIAHQEKDNMQTSNLGLEGLPPNGTTLLFCLHPSPSPVGQYTGQLTTPQAGFLGPLSKRLLEIGQAGGQVLAVGWLTR